MAEQIGPVPNRFTGKWRGKLYWRGAAWEGPTNLLGFGRKHMTDTGALTTSDRPHKLL